MKMQTCAMGTHIHTLETIMYADSCGRELDCTALQLCHADLDVHEQPTHKEAEGATTVVDPILYLIGRMERDDVGVVIQEDTPARTMHACEYECCQAASTSVSAITCLQMRKCMKRN